MFSKVRTLNMAVGVPRFSLARVAFPSLPLHFLKKLVDVGSLPFFKKNVHSLKLIYVILVGCSAFPYLQLHVGSGSLTGFQTWVCSIGSAES